MITNQVEHEAGEIQTIFLLWYCVHKYQNLEKQEVVVLVTICTSHAWVYYYGKFLWDYTVKTAINCKQTKQQNNVNKHYVTE